MCFCTTHSFHETIVPCIANRCDDVEETQTEQYAKGICSAVGVDLPSFQQFLAYQKPVVISSSETLVHSTPPTSTGLANITTTVQPISHTASPSVVSWKQNNTAGKVEVSSMVINVIIATIGIWGVHYIWRRNWIP